MPKPIRITIEFDDGSTHVVDPSANGSIFTSADKARAHGKREPFRDPPRAGDDVTAMSAGECYIVNGVVVCP